MNCHKVCGWWVFPIDETSIVAIVAIGMGEIGLHSLWFRIQQRCCNITEDHHRSHHLGLFQLHVFIFYFSIPVLFLLFSVLNFPSIFLEIWLSTLVIFEWTFVNRVYGMSHIGRDLVGKERLGDSNDLTPLILGYTGELLWVPLRK